VQELAQWLKANGGVDAADRSIFSVFYAQELLKPNSKLKSPKALGIGRGAAASFSITKARPLRVALRLLSGI
jgi:hypothetical protein